MSFISEVREHPSALKAMLDHNNRSEEKGRLAEFLGAIKPKRVVFSGMGSSFFSSQVAALYLRRNGYDAAAYESGELHTAEFISLEGADLFIAVSQTGNSNELVQVCEKLNGRIPLLSVTNNAEHSVGKFGDYVFELCAGQELFTASKTYTNTFGALLVVCDALLEVSGMPDGGFRQLLYKSAEDMQTVLNSERSYTDAVGLLEGIENYTMIGSGFSNATACHGELVAAEAAKIFASRFTLGQYIHGPIEMACPKFAYFVFDSDPAFYDASSKVIDTILSLGGNVFRVGVQPREFPHSNYHQLLIPNCPPETAPMLEVIVLELIINQVGSARGLEPGALSIVQK